ncbi:MAG: hypothetical protein U9R47_01435 [Actinomycetota bacterium]|nr:hypothetical protein [Actinomycetota bacterium]
MVTGPFGALMVTGNPGDQGIVVDELVVDEVVVDGANVAATVVVAPSVDLGPSPVSDDDPHAAATSAIAASTVGILRDMVLLLSREEPS